MSLPIVTILLHVLPHLIAFLVTFDARAPRVDVDGMTQSLRPQTELLGRTFEDAVDVVEWSAETKLDMEIMVRKAVFGERLTRERMQELHGDMKEQQQRQYEKVWKELDDFISRVNQQSGDL